MGEVSAAVACTSECFQLTHLASLVSRWWRNRVPVQETRSDPWVGQIPLKKAMAAHSGISCLENPMDRGAWWGTVQGVARVRHSWVSEQQQRLTPDGFFHILPEVWGWSVEVESWLASEDKNTGVLAMAHCWLLFVRCHSWPGKWCECADLDGWDLHCAGRGHQRNVSPLAVGVLLLAFLLLLGLCRAHFYYRWFCFHWSFPPPSSSSQGLLEMSCFYILISFKNWKNSKKKTKTTTTKMIQGFTALNHLWFYCSFPVFVHRPM